MQKLSLPRAFEPEFYRGTYPYLPELTDAESLEYYRTEGIRSGHTGSPAAERGHLLSFAHTEGSILEIGPFHAPSIVGEHVRYMDVLTTEELIQAVRNAGHDTSNVPTIHYVAPKGGFDMVERKFSAVFSGHCIEHQPDLIRHFQGVSSVLEDDGRYYIACPDRRYCFDHYLPETAVVDVLAAYHAKRKVHQPRSFIAQRLHRAHNDADRHWSGDHGPQPYQSYQNARSEIFDGLPGEDAYHDAHAWQFTPASFFRIMSFLHEVGLTDFVIERVYHTRFGTQEFTAVLRKGQHVFDKDEVYVDPVPLEDSVSFLKKEKSRAEREIETLKNEIARVESEAAILKQENSRTDAEVARLKNDLGEVLSSRSWALTRPLRRFITYLGIHRR